MSLVVNMPRGLILVRPRPQRGWRSSSTDPQMVVKNNWISGIRRHRTLCFRHMAGEIFFAQPYVSTLKILRLWWRIQKWMKSAKNNFDPAPTSGSDLG